MVRTSSIAAALSDLAIVLAGRLADDHIRVQLILVAQQPHQSWGEDPVVNLDPPVIDRHRQIVERLGGEAEGQGLRRFRLQVFIASGDKGERFVIASANCST